jgi:hypothetical protein
MADGRDWLRLGLPDGWTDTGSPANATADPSSEQPTKNRFTGGLLPMTVTI